MQQCLSHNFQVVQITLSRPGLLVVVYYIGVLVVVLVSFNSKEGKMLRKKKKIGGDFFKVNFSNFVYTLPFRRRKDYLAVISGNAYC